MYIVKKTGIFFLLLVASSLSHAVKEQPVDGGDAYSSSNTARIQPVSDKDFYDDGAPSVQKVALGRVLFFDKILSGNKNISCATCHHPLSGTSDGLSLPIGEGGKGLSITRTTGRGKNKVKERVPRNSPALFNLGAKEFSVLFHDGRVQLLDGRPGNFESPAGHDLPPGLDNPLAVQAMFPPTSGTEMAGQSDENLVENPVAEATAAGDLPAVWELLAARLRENEGYQGLFSEVYGIAPDDITMVHAANAIAAYEAVVFRADNSPFDRYLRGDRGGMSRDAMMGKHLFFGEAGCSGCHSGAFQTDHSFHSIAMPQIGPGKGDGDDGHEDFGRERVTGSEEDRYKFITPSLRNVALTGPWGHAGSYNSLEAVVRHHLDPETSFDNYDASQRVLPSRRYLNRLDLKVMNGPDDIKDAIKDSSELTSIELTDDEVNMILAFLHALTDPSSLDLRHDVPKKVPSGAAIFD